MQYTIQLDPVVEHLIEDLRMNHIDAELIIKEELDQIIHRRPFKGYLWGGKIMGSNILTNKNRLSITNPELCTEWDYQKNYPLKPKDVTYGSGKRVWWKCKTGKMGHEWRASIFSRSGSMTGCPYCSKHKTSDDNRLSLKHPQLLKEWDYKRNKTDPSTISVCSTEKVWWICKKDSRHSWQALVYSRTASGTGCPYCLNQKVNKSNCIATTHPHLIKQWHPIKNKKLTPYNTVIGCEKTVWWICAKGHEYSARPSYKKANDRSKYGHDHHRGECPYCNGVKVCRETCLATVNPKIASEWHPTKNLGLTPYNIFPNTNKVFWWKCKNGHEWKSTVNNRNSGNVCPLCSGIILKDGTMWDSYTEAYVYLKFKHRGFIIEPHKKYGVRKTKCDFYLPKYNLYCEITSFNKNDCPPHTDFWKTYLEKIRRKRKVVQEKLNANFRFIHIKKLNKSQRLQVIREKVN